MTCLQELSNLGYTPSQSIQLAGMQKGINQQVPQVPMLQAPPQAPLNSPEKPAQVSMPQPVSSTCPYSQRHSTARLLQAAQFNNVPTSSKGQVAVDKEGEEGEDKVKGVMQAMYVELAAQF